MIYLLDNARRQHRAQLREALYIASYPHDIFLVARAINRGATITFEKEETMVTKDGTRFDIHESQFCFTCQLLKLMLTKEIGVGAVRESIW